MIGILREDCRRANPGVGEGDLACIGKQDAARKEMIVTGFMRSLLGPKIGAGRVLEQVETVETGRGRNLCASGFREESHALDWQMGDVLIDTTSLIRTRM